MKEIMRATLAFMTAFLMSAGWAADITAEVRAGGGATYDRVEGGTVYSGSAIGRAFDGLYVDDGNRLLLTPSPSGGQMKIYYTINDDFHPNDKFVVESFTFRRSQRAYDYERSPTRMRLEGSADGTDWVLLAENADAFPLVNNKGKADLPSDDVEHLEYTVPVPRVRQANYRKYRFTTLSYATATPNPVVIHELFLNGRIVSSPELTWNGGRTGGTWDATTENWLTSGGEATAWIPGSCAYVDAESLTVDGKVVVGALRFPDGRTPVISGGTLQMVYPGEIDVSHADLQVSSDVVAAGFSGEDTVTSCAQGERDATYTMLPRSESDETAGKEVVWWKNRCLRDVAGALSAKVLYSGNWRSDPFAVSSFRNDGTQASCWFWQYYSQKDAGASYAWLVVKVNFTQVGADICARLNRGGFVWLSTAQYGTDGSKIDFEGVTINRGKVWDDAHTGLSGTTIGIKDILLKTEIASSGLCVNNVSDAWRLVDGRLPRDPDNKNAGVAVDYFRNMTLDDIVGFESAGLHYGNGDGLIAQPFHLSRSADSLTVQFQRMNGTAVIGVMVQFCQNGPNVSARAVYAHYTYDHPLGWNLDNTGSQPIALPGDSTGYNVSGIVPILAKRSVELAGNVSVADGIGLHALDLALSGESVALSDVSGSGSLVLAPGTGIAQTVAVNAPGTVVPRAAIVGSTALAFADGATLAFGTLDLHEATAARVPVTLGENMLRIGTSSNLTKGELKLFAPPGKCARQDENGYLTLEDAPGLGVFIR